MCVFVYVGVRVYVCTHTHAPCYIEKQESTQEGAISTRIVVSVQSKSNLVTTSSSTVHSSLVLAKPLMSKPSTGHHLYNMQISMN